MLVANLDRLYAVFSASTPPMNPRVLDRFLVVAELDDIPASIVANKIDEVSREEAERAFGPYAELGYPVLYTSVVDGTGLDALRSELTDRVSAFVGPSGVGKSSLLNAIAPGLGLAVGEISETLDKGRHTTRVAELHPLPSGGWVADTPGIREIASFRLPEAELAGCFPSCAPSSAPAASRAAATSPSRAAPSRRRRARRRPRRALRQLPAHPARRRALRSSAQVKQGLSLCRLLTLPRARRSEGLDAIGAV
ncbi:MAG: ribosome small subunit-dependent GTPase A [Sandaracinaceae bacterium]|nr:ribosome small subunit-dependent GTPase A [Sandaracinaceae bacterium]